MVRKLGFQLVGFVALVALLSTMRHIPSKEVRRDLSLCEASRLKEPATVTVAGFVQSYEMSGVNSTLVLSSQDGCKILVSASQSVIGEALPFLGRGIGYATVTGIVKDGMISPKSNQAVSVRSIIQECNIPIYGGWEENHNGQVRTFTKSRFNPTPTPIGVKPEVKFTIPRDGKWHVGCIEDSSGIRKVISVSRR